MFEVGDKVEIICCRRYPSLVGRKCVVMEPEKSLFSNPLKIRVSLDDAWQGFFYPCELIKLK